MKLPTTVFSGFLGSGKTTIIAHLVDYLQAHGEQVIYIKNEIGDENIDSQLFQGKLIQTKELLNGCICCTLVGPFIQAIDEIAESFHPDRIIIEASGAADPAAIAMMIDSHPRLKRDGVISIIDVVNFEGYKDLSLTAQNQTKFTDLLVFNKIELVGLKRKEAVVGYVRELNNHSPVVEAPLGILDPTVAFGLNTTELNDLLATAKDHEATDHHHDHLTVDGIENFHVTLSGTVAKKTIEDFLTQLPGSVYRVKGFIDSASEPGTSLSVNKVGNRLTIEPVETEPKAGRNTIVFIGFRISTLHKKITTELTALVPKK